jgi:hypothetical protein
VLRSIFGTSRNSWGVEKNFDIEKNFGAEIEAANGFSSSYQDGVRLGCYGYELEGKKYSTQYVADSRGYRIVSTQDLITVYPKSGGTR